LKVLAILQSYDRNDPAVGFVVRWMEAMAQRVDKLMIMALLVAEHSPHSNIEVLSLGKESLKGPFRRLRYLLRWHRNIRKAISQKPDLIFTHMTPIYSVLAAPYAYWSGIPIITWFSYPGMRPTLATRLCYRVSKSILSIHQKTYPHPTHDKVIGLGHGIDTDLFSPNQKLLDGPPIILCVGRVAQSKNHLILIEALRQMAQSGRVFKCLILGNVLEKDREYYDRVKAAISDSELSDIVELVGAVPNHLLPDWYRRATVHVDACHILDKTNLEAMASGIPVLAPRGTNDRFLSPWENQLLFDNTNPEELSQRLENILDMPEAERKEIGSTLRQRIEADYSLNRLSDRIVKVFHENAVISFLLASCTFL